MIANSKYLSPVSERWSRILPFPFRASSLKKREWDRMLLRPHHPGLDSSLLEASNQIKVLSLAPKVPPDHRPHEMKVMGLYLWWRTPTRSRDGPT